MAASTAAPCFTGRQIDQYGTSSVSDKYWDPCHAKHAAAGMAGGKEAIISPRASSAWSTQDGYAHIVDPERDTSLEVGVAGARGGPGHVRTSDVFRLPAAGCQGAWQRAGVADGVLIAVNNTWMPWADQALTAFGRSAPPCHLFCCVWLACRTWAVRPGQQQQQLDSTTHSGMIRTAQRPPAAASRSSSSRGQSFLAMMARAPGHTASRPLTTMLRPTQTPAASNCSSRSAPQSSSGSVQPANWRTSWP